MKLSRDAEVLAVCLFSMGKCCQVTFVMERVLNKRTKAAFKELENADMIEKIPSKSLARGSYGWQARPEIGFPLRTIKRPSKEESFELFV